jgi:hypothetical protein
VERTHRYRWSRDVLQLVLLEEDVVVFASLISLRLVVFLDPLAGDGIHIMADDAVVGRAIERVRRGSILGSAQRIR